LKDDENGFSRTDLKQVRLRIFVDLIAISRNAHSIASARLSVFTQDPTRHFATVDCGTAKDSSALEVILVATQEIAVTSSSGEWAGQNSA
jgi:hypothetical protein